MPKYRQAVPGTSASTRQLGSVPSGPEFPYSEFLQSAVKFLVSSDALIRRRAKLPDRKGVTNPQLQ